MVNILIKMKQPCKNVKLIWKHCTAGGRVSVTIVEVCSCNQWRDDNLWEVFYTVSTDIINYYMMVQTIHS